jgi:hypothetical protein
MNSRYRIFCLILGLLFSNFVLADNVLIKPPAESIQVPSSVTPPDEYGHTAPYLLVTCMDFRLRDEVEKFMELRFGPDQYDEIALPGASLGAFNEEFPHWQKTFEDVVQLSIQLHQTSKIIFLDHQDCGAYKKLKGEMCCHEKAKETQVHAEQFHAVRSLLHDKFPDLQIETLIMGLDGQVETVH